MLHSRNATVRGEGGSLLEQTMTDVLSMPVLALNRYFQPVQVTTVKRGFVLLYGGAAQAIDEDGEAYDFDGWRQLPLRSDDDALPIVGGKLRVPRVVHLHRYDRTPRVTVRLTRRNLMFRDAHQCQYCGKRPAMRDLNIDHVLPRSRGGPDTWENLVWSSRQVNTRKGNRLPHEAGLKLLNEPRAPKEQPASALIRNAHGIAEWKLFLKAQS